MSTDGRGIAGRVVSPVLVGRDGELGRMIGALAVPPSVVVIEGEGGIGKSRLVTELLARPEVAGRRILSGGCSQIREPFPLGPVVEALRSVGGDLEGAVLSPVAGALRALFPELAPVLPQPPDPLDDRAAERHRLFRGLSEVLAALGTAVLVVEDLHWADEQTVEFLSYLLGNQPRTLSVVLTYRGEEVPAGVRALTARPADALTREHVVLVPLDEGQTRELAAAILGSDQVSEEFAAHLCGRASGLPLAIQELLALLRTRGALIPWAGGWARKELDELDVPSGVRSSVQERVGRLSPAARAVAEAAAVLQLTSPVPVLTGVTGLPPSAAADGVDEVLDAGLFAEREGTVGFRHVLASQAVYEGIPLGRRQALHSAAADAVQSLVPVPLGQVAHHLRQAGRDDEWVAAAKRAADQAVELGDDGEAARLMEEVLRRARLPAPDRAELTVRLGWVATEVLHVPDVCDLFVTALNDDLPRAVRGELRLLLALHLNLARSDPARERREMAAAVGDLSDRPELAAWAMMALGLPTAPGTRPDERVEWLDRALETVPEIGDPTMRLYLLGKIVMALVLIGDPRWRELADRMEKDVDELPTHRRTVNVHFSIGAGAVLTGDHHLARRLLATALERSAEIDATGTIAVRCKSCLLQVAYLSGAWEGLAEEVRKLRVELSERPERDSVALVAAGLLLAEGELDLARSRFLDGMRIGLTTDVADLPFAVTALLRLGIARGTAVAALAETAEAVAAWEKHGLWPLGVRALPALTEALRAAGRQEEAAGVVARYESRLRGLVAPLAAPALEHARGHLAASAGRWREAVGHFTGAAAGYERLPAAYEAAQASEQAAACLFEAGDDTAEQALKDVLAAYERLGARWDLDRAIWLGRRHGLRAGSARRRGADGGGDGGDGGAGRGLTARQREVARLAATGLTNQQIARELFLSTKTVDKHLSAAMQKFGARSRTELARQLERPPED
ncbi:helix-turn-helix transcriptional regulator [Nonomuraea sp. LPB2021202275-12-8]|uniref:helix-turn-helix transcriptional regulator n=1 Tax=Nonomuraea sp. LPB2021202275-12-8 TaxID=3120159 RepID=UPI00300CD905